MHRSTWMLRSETARRLIVLLAAVLAAGLAARLGMWQLQRAADKTALFNQHVVQAALPPLRQAELVQHAPVPAGQLYRRVVLHGVWLSAHTIYLDNRQMDGRPGFFVVTPLLLGPDDAVLVQRGWLPRDPAVRTHIVAPATPSGPVRVEGHIAPGLARLFEFDAGASGAIRQNLDLDEFARETGLALRPIVVQQSDGDAGDGLLRHWRAPVLDVSTHYGYAFQWFSLCALFVGLYVWFQLIRPRLRRAR